MSIPKLPNLRCYRSVDSNFSNEGVTNAMTRDRFIKILQNIHFADIQAAEKFDKPYKIRVVFRHLNKAFQTAMPDAERQSVDERITKFKERMPWKHYMKNIPIK